MWPVLEASWTEVEKGGADGMGEEVGNRDVMHLKEESEIHPFP